MLDRVLELARALRTAGIPVAVSEDIDALGALSAVPWVDRETVRASLAATMIKNQGHRPAFDILFDIYFGGTAEEQQDPDARGTEGPERGDDLLEELYGVLASGDGGAVGDMARRAVELFGRIENSPSDSLYFQYPVFRTVDLEALLARYEEELAGSGVGPVELRLLRDEFERRVAAFRSAVATDVRRRVAQRKGPESVARNSVRPLPEDVEILTAGTDEIKALRRAIRPLARKLATRLALKRRRGRTGRLDIRKTVRHSLSTGGAPFDIHLRHPAPHRPELFVLCDISDSVSRFARFSLMLVHALSAQFSRVRSFVFIDTLDEVTRLFEHEDFLVAVDRMAGEANVVSFDGHSNYGASLQRFWANFGKQLGPKATILILGDARNNFRATNSHVLKEMSRKAHRAYWLNPEPEAYWDSGDSRASEYAAQIDGMIEVRNLRQLEEFVARVL